MLPIDSIKFNIENTKWVNTGGLLVPFKNKTQKQDTVDKVIDEFAIYTTLSELTGHKIPIENIIEYIKGFNKYEIVSLVSKLNILLDNIGYFNLEPQKEFVKRYFPDNLKEKTLILLNNDRNRFVLFQQQLLAVMYLAMQFGSSHKKFKFGNTSILKKFVEIAVLGIADHIEDEENFVNSTSTGDAIESFCTMIVRNMSLNSQEQLRYVLPRYYMMLFEITRNKKIKKSANFMNIENLFRRATKVKLEVFYSIAFGILAQYINIKQIGSPSNFIINKGIYFKNTKITKKEISSALKFLTITNQDIHKRNSVVSTTRHINPYDLLLFRSKPLYRFNKYNLTVTDLRFLKERVTGGVFWDIHDFLPSNDRFKLYRFFGELFEIYIQKLFLRCFKTTRGFAKRIYLERVYKVKKQELKCSDVIICYEDTLFFIEVNASRLNMVKTLINGDINSLSADLQKIVFASTGQLDRSIKDFKEEKLKLKGIEKDEIKYFVPVLVTLMSLPYNELFWKEEIEGGLISHKQLQDSDVRKLELLDAEECEMLEPLLNSGKSLKDIFTAKNESKKFKFLPMKNYLLFEYSSNRQKELENTFLHKKFHMLANKFALNLFGIRLKKKKSK